MGKFAKAETQAASVIKALQKLGAIKSLRTADNYRQALTQVCRFVKNERLGSLRDLTQEQATSYLNTRGEEVSQKTLDQERHAIQVMMQHLTHKLDVKSRLACNKSIHQQILNSRSYTAQQVSMTAEAQLKRNSLSTEIAYAAGLRGHELLTIRRIEERDPSSRSELAEKFQGREGKRYTVKGKGGLVREVCIPSNLAQQLESRRLKSPVKVTDRSVHYAKYYDINGGKNWSSSFTQASKRTLGWSSGAHGLRHSYAQERMHELQSSGMKRDLALEVVSQEMGHFRKDITEIYLR